MPLRLIFRSQGLGGHAEPSQSPRARPVMRRRCLAKTCVGVLCYDMRARGGVLRYGVLCYGVLCYNLRARDCV